jgi:hypothetical protein
LRIAIIIGRTVPAGTYGTYRGTPKVISLICFSQSVTASNHYLDPLASLVVVLFEEHHCTCTDFNLSICCWEEILEDRSSQASKTSMLSPALGRFLANNDTTKSSTDDANPVFVTNNKDAQIHSIVVGLLIGIILFLSVALLFLIGPPMLRFVRSKIPVSQKRMNRRYETIERWLISKVSFS